MKCPACGGELKRMVVHDVSVEVCDGGCGGIWFDNFEIKKFDEPREDAEILLNIERDDAVAVDHNKRRLCPKCWDVMMMRHFYSPNREIEVDECPKCGGYWLDAGELSTLRDQFETEEERREAAMQYFEEVFGEQFSQVEAQSHAKLDKARRIARIFRFLCPSYYVPGKQEWGAF